MNKLEALKALFFDEEEPADVEEIVKYDEMDEDELRLRLKQNELEMERVRIERSKLEKALSDATDTEDAPEYVAPGRGNADRPMVAFVGASPSKIDFVRDRPFCGLVGKTMKDTYLPPLGLTEDDVYMTNIVKEFCFDDERRPTDPAPEKIKEALPEFVKEMEAVKPRFIVALGKTAKEAISEIAEEWVPHPRAINMNSDSGEVERKMSRLKKRMDEPDAHMDGVILKSGDEKQIVYGVVMEPMENDTDFNWTTPDQIEEASHMFMKHFQAIDVEHNRDDIAATPVESWIAHEDTIIGGQEVKAGSWVMGVKIDDPDHWQAVKDGEYGGFSIDATARINPNILLG